MSSRRIPRLAGFLLAALTTVLLGVVAAAPSAFADPIAPITPPAAVSPITPTAPISPEVPAVTGPSVHVDLNGIGGKPSQSIVIILLMTVLSIAPAALILCTSFTKIAVVLSLTRNALGLQNVPPNQVLVGLALFLSLFIMGPTLSKMNSEGVQPYLHGTKSQTVAYHDGVAPLRDFMLKQTRKPELAMFLKASGNERPDTANDVPMTSLVPAFVLSELRAAFIIGFVIFIPFLIIDLVVSSSLMSMGMMMLPPVMISLPFKLLLFVMVDGWMLIVKSLITSYQ